MATVLSADGCVEVGEIPPTGCCPPPLCGNDLCGMFCAFVNILPCGPMWDYWKERVTAYFQFNSDPLQCEAIIDPKCPSLVQHAIYCVMKMRDVVHNALWPALRESSPITACETIDDWLRRLKWEDCYRQHCRSVLLGELTPYEIQGPCGPIFCEVNLPPELELAVKRGILIALTRANMGVIKNLCGLNWIVEPLGAKVEPVPGSPDDCCDVQLQVAPLSTTINSVVCLDICDTLGKPPEIPAFIESGCESVLGVPQTIYPGTIAAECIIRSLLPMTCDSPITIKSSCGQDLLLLSGDQDDGSYVLFSGDQAVGRTVILI